MGSYATMKKVLESTGLYDTDKQNINSELVVYASELDRIKNKLLYMLCECFINTAQTYGLALREQVFGAVRDDLTIEKRREMLTLREQLDSSCFTPEKIKSALESFGLEFELYEYPSLYSVVIDTVGHYTAKEKSWIRSQVKKIMPAHLVVEVVFNGPSWVKIDGYSNTFLYMDSCDMTWAEIDDLE